MERKAALGGRIFVLYSFTPNQNGSLDLVYWVGEVNHSELRQVNVSGFIFLKTGDLEMIKVMDQNHFGRYF